MVGTVAIAKANKETGDIYTTFKLGSIALARETFLKGGVCGTACSVVHAQWARLIF